MKAALILVFSAVSALVGPAQDMLLTNSTATFRTLEGKTFYNVTLVKGDLDGIIWRSGASGGRICYTNFDPELLASWGVGSNRLDVALARAQHKAVADARYRTVAAAESAATLKRRREEQARVASQVPLREREMQRQTDLAQIQALRRQTEVARDSLNHMEAAAREANLFKINNPNLNVPFFYVKESTRVDLEQSEKRLQQLEAQYAAKYGNAP
jgi:hypothetical protein